MIDEASADVARQVTAIKIKEDASEKTSRSSDYNQPKILTL